MVFSSVPVYLDPHNWQQQINQQPGDGRENNQLPPPVPSPSTRGGGGTGTGSVRPGSMAERARLVNFPQPEGALKCPRCESTNTKFCYFNNYSLTQPRHFCKTCRRYWTRGGALRSVPVGGGCRKNKRSKGRRSKSPARIESRAVSSSTAAVSTDMMGYLLPPPPQLPLLPSLPHLSDYGRSGDIGLNFAGIQPPVAATSGGNGGADMGFQIGSGSSGTILSARFPEQWRLQQVQHFPFLAGLEPPAGIYPFEGEAAHQSGQLGSMPLDLGVTQPATTVKIEENQGLNLSRNFLGLPGNDQYWGGNAWSDLSGFTSSTTSHLL